MRNFYFSNFSELMEKLFSEINTEDNIESLIQKNLLNLDSDEELKTFVFNNFNKDFAIENLNYYVGNQGMMKEQKKRELYKKKRQTEFIETLKSLNALL